MKYIGIKFKIPNEYGKNLGQILERVDDNNYIWKIDEDEIYNNEATYLFEKKRYTNDDFKKIIDQVDYYTVFANIKLYEKEDEVRINNYEDFLESSCIFILFITDNIFVEIYSKNKDIIEIIYENALKNKFTDINYITKENYKRKYFSAYRDQTLKMKKIYI